jgi:hypothetical protein
VFVLGTVAAVALYAAYANGAARWPGGSSLPGMLLGTAGGAIILFEFLLWPRRWKRVRAWRIGRTQTWMRAHIWLGLLSVPLIWLHSGFTWGGQLSTLLAVLFIVVIRSGVFGLALQQVVPRMLLNSVPAETIYSQIEHVSRQCVADAEELIAATCGREPQSAATLPAAMAAADAPEQAVSPFLVVGAMRTVGSVRGKVLQTHVPAAVVPNAELLRTTFQTTVRPFLKDGPRSNSPLQRAEAAKRLFEELRLRMDPAAHSAIAALENWCDSRRQFALQARLHWWLHAWLCVHLPLSIALVGLMFAHIFVAVKYW